MSLLNPSASYHVTLQGHLGLVGRALALQRALLWMSRGLVLGIALDLTVVLWAWTRDGLGSVPFGLFAIPPVILAALAATIALFVRHSTPELARRVDRAAGLQERSVTALELGRRGDEHPLALAQMRDAVEHLRRVELLETFPLRAPRPELFVGAVLAALAVIFAVVPNPWLLSARAANPTVTAAQEQAQKVDRMADALNAQQNPQLAPLQDLLKRGAQTMQTQSNQPDDVLSSIDDLQQAIQAMSANDDQLSAALAAIASALASDPSTQQLAAAINSGDLNQISRATRSLAQQTAQMDSQQRQQVAAVLRQAAINAGQSSEAVSSDLSAAAAALQGGQDGQTAQDAQNGQDGSQSGASAQTSAQQALNELANSTDAAAARQNASSQLQASQNALERALGRAPSRSTSSGGGPGTGSSSAQQGQSNGQSGQDGQEQGQGSGQQGGQDQSGDQGGQQGNGASGNSNGGNGQSGGSGYSTGGQNQNNTGNPSSLDSVTRPEQVPSDGSASPDTSSQDPYLGQAGKGNSTVGQEAVNPS
ncbi:MAG: hypothetical protein JO023_05735, partial [Chloroflexi bacterium]|nr:hypothetical protein [Chloroflexota bacterium]